MPPVQAAASSQTAPTGFRSAGRVVQPGMRVRRPVTASRFVFTPYGVQVSRVARSSLALGASAAVSAGLRTRMSVTR